ncbi:MAG: hypothetical protein WC640_01540 [Candidatus Paceibacterota bacterium]|jgi:hypothetical protein
MDETNLATRRVVRISRRKLVVFVVIILILIALGFVVLSSLSSARIRTANYVGMSAPEMGLGDSYTAKTISPYYDGGQQPSIADTREFLKTSYSSTIKTRDVSGVIKDVKSAIKVADGRIDNLYSSEKSGRISFVVAKSKFEDFRSEIESLTYTKLYTESISSQNLLSQKQGIESQTISVLNTLESLKKQKDDLGLKHTQTINSISNELARIRAELADVRITIAEETDSSTITLLRNQENSLVEQEALQRQKLSGENNNYSSQNQNLDRMISNANNNLTSVNDQSSQFANNIETVNGTITISWVSWWQIAKIYSPISPTVIVIAIIIILWILFRRKGWIPKIIFD